MNKYLNDINKRKKYMITPYIVIAAYVLVTLLISLFGPVEYQYYTVERKVSVAVYIVVFLVITYIGMKLAIVSHAPREGILKRNTVNAKKYILVVEIMILLVFVIKLSLLLYQVYRYGIAISELSFTAIAQVYTNLHTTAGDFNIFRKIDSFTRILTYLSFFSGAYLWKKLGKSCKILLSISVFFDLAYNLLFIGTQRSILTYLILFILLYVVKVVQSGKGIKRKNIVFCTIFAIGMLLLFTKMIGARYETWGSVMSTEFRNGMKFLPEHCMVSWLPEDMKYAFITILSYPTQGYYGLSMCFDTPFQWTGFLGGARGLNSIVSQVIPEIPNFLYSTYPVRTGELMGFDGLASWYTIFPWLAGDVTFLGALVLMICPAYVFAKCWKEVNLYSNPLSFAMLAQLVVFYVFIPANNQLFIDRGDSLGMVLLIIIWIFFHKKLNYYVDE